MSDVPDLPVTVTLLTPPDSDTAAVAPPRRARSSTRTPLTVTDALPEPSSLRSSSAGASWAEYTQKVADSPRRASTTPEPESAAPCAE